MERGDVPGQNPFCWPSPCRVGFAAIIQANEAEVGLSLRNPRCWSLSADCYLIVFRVPFKLETGTYCSLMGRNAPLRKRGVHVQSEIYDETPGCSVVRARLFRTVRRNVFAGATGSSAADSSDPERRVSRQPAFARTYAVEDCNADPSAD